MLYQKIYAYILISLVIFLIFSQIFSTKAHIIVRSNLAPDIIIYNGNIITMEDSFQLEQALAIQDDLIYALGNESEILAMAGSNTLLIDLEGKTLMPGFIDSHSHWIGDRNLVNQTTPDEAIETALSYGWTSISELFVNQDRLNELQSLDEQDKLRIRVNAYLPLSWQFERFGDWYQIYQPGQEFSSKLRIGGVKIFADGWVGPNRVLFFNQSELTALMQEAHSLGFQIATHSVVPNATDIVLNSLETILAGESKLQYRHRIEHLVLLTDDQIQQMRDLGIIASFQFTWFNSDWIDDIETNLDVKYMNLLARWRDLLDAGVTAIGSTDRPWSIGEIGSAIKSINMVVTRIGEQGLSPPDYLQNQTISVEQALRLLTINAAYGTFQENRTGSIKVGKFADLVVLSDNPLTVTENNLVDITVLMTMVGGLVEYCTSGQQALCTGTIYSRTFDDSNLNQTSGVKSTDITTTNHFTISVLFSIITFILLKRKKK